MFSKRSFRYHVSHFCSSLPTYIIHNIMWPVRHYNRKRDTTYGILAHRDWTMTFIAKTFYDLHASTLEGETIDFNIFRGRVVLIENVASLWGTTAQDYSQLNELQSRYPHRLVVLGFPCNQFGYQVCAQKEHFTMYSFIVLKV